MLMLGKKPVSPLCMPYAGIEKATNCILEIPQNIKLELNNNVLTLKAGSIVTLTGSSTYTTVTVASDRTKDFSSYSDGDIVVFANSVGGLGNDGLLNRIGSGNTLPSDSNTYGWYYLTTDYSIYHWENSSWTKKNVTYPLCILHKSENNVSFVKDSNGNDMIFNGAGFIGHHAFVYPNVKALIPDGFNDDGSLKSIAENENALRIVEIQGSKGFFAFSSATGAVVRRPSCFEVNNLDELYAKNLQGFYYVKSINQSYSWGGGSGTLYPGNMVFIGFSYNGTTVTDFTIQQPLTKYKWVVKLIP